MNIFCAPPLVSLALPSWLTERWLFGVSLWQWLLLAALFLCAFLVGTAMQWLLVFAGRRLAKRLAGDWDERVLAVLPGPTRLLLAMLLARLWLPQVGLDPVPREFVETLIRIVFIASLTWLILRTLTLAGLVIERLLARGVSDPVLLRANQTRVAVPLAIVRFLVLVVGVALVCLQLEVVRSVGLSLLASAGLAGLVMGLAAQRVLANLLAGIQLAFTQPIKLGDAVTVEGEFGTVESIGLTQVIVALWDERRLVIPVSYFIDRPVQNWTRQSTQVLGVVLLTIDRSVAVQDVRRELGRILESTPLWDRREQKLQVTALTPTTAELRLLMSAADPATLWDLRCLVRERLLTWLQAGRQA